MYNVLAMALRGEAPQVETVAQVRRRDDDYYGHTLPVVEQVERDGRAGIVTVAISHIIFQTIKRDYLDHEVAVFERYTPPVSLAGPLYTGVRS